MMDDSNYILFVVDTDTHAGNFEREMCAYMTGQIGECSVGEEQADIAQREIPCAVSQLEEIIGQIPDDHGCSRPVSIFPNPHYGNDGNGKEAKLTPQNKSKFPFPAYSSVAIYFCEKPGPDLLQLLKDRARKYASKNKITVECFRLLERRIVYTELEF